MVIGQQMKKEFHDQSYWWFLHFTFHSFVNEVWSVSDVFWTLSIKYIPTFKGGAF